MCDDESQTGSNRTVIKQSCINTSLFLCGSFGIVCLSWRPVFLKQKKSPNKIRSHLDRKCSFRLPGIQTAEIFPTLHKKKTCVINKRPQAHTCGILYICAAG